LFSGEIIIAENNRDVLWMGTSPRIRIQEIDLNNKADYSGKVKYVPANLMLQNIFL